MTTNLEFDDGEHGQLVETWRQIIDYDPFPLSPRVRTVLASKRGR